MDKLVLYYCHFDVRKPTNDRDNFIARTLIVTDGDSRCKAADDVRKPRSCETHLVFQSHSKWLDDFVAVTEIPD